MTLVKPLKKRIHDVSRKVRFAIFPRRLDDGSVIWLERYIKIRQYSYISERFVTYYETYT
jgi:hypothetical protein